LRFIHSSMRASVRKWRKNDDLKMVGWLRC
jgi:hypothetical protein